MTAQKRASTSSSKKSSKQPKTETTAPTPTSTTYSSSSSYSKYNSSNNATSTHRLQNTTICLPIVYGSIAFFLGKKADEYHTHRWTLYVRGPNNEDLSAGIAKVVFHLHPSFAQPVRELTAPPFEVTEKGWGEFEATIRLVWRDPTERPTVLTHGIKLYPPGLAAVTPATTPSTKEPVVHEFYDEVVFTDPTETFHKQLQRWSVLPKVATKEDAINHFFTTFSDDDDFRTLASAQQFLDGELKAVKERIMRAEREKMQIEKGLKAIAQQKASGGGSTKAGGGKGGGGSGGGVGSSKKSGR